MTVSRDLTTNTDTITTSTGTITVAATNAGSGLTLGDPKTLGEIAAAAAQASLTKASSASGAVPAVQTAATTSNTSLAAVPQVSTTSAASLVSAIASLSPSLITSTASLTTAQTQLALANTEANKIVPAQTGGAASLATIAAQVTIASTALGSGTTTLDPNPTLASSTVASSCGTAQACADLASQYSAVATARQAAGDFANALNAAGNASVAAGNAAKYEAIASAALTTAQTEKAAIDARLATATAANSAATTAVSNTTSSAIAAVGDLGVVAQVSATNALASKDSVNTISTTTLPGVKTAAATNNTSLQAIAAVSTASMTSLVNAILALPSSAISDAAKLSTAQTQLALANTEAAKIGPAQAAATTALATIDAQLVIASTALGSGTTTLDPNPSLANSTVAAGCGSALACSDLAAQYAALAVSSQSAKDFVSAGNAVGNANVAASRAATFQQTANTALSTAQSAKATIDAGLSTASAASSAATAALASTNTNAIASVGDLGAIAQIAANSSSTAKTSINTISTELGTTVSGSTAQQVFDSVSATNTTAQADAAIIAAIAIDTAAATTSLNSVTAVTGAAQNTANTATSVNTANGSFADSQAAAALTAMNAANSLVQGAGTTATTQNGIVTTQATALSTAKTSAATQATAASTAFTNSQTTLNAISAAAAVDSGVTNVNQTVTSLLALATTAATNAQTAATSAAAKQSALDFAGASTDMQTALSENNKAQAALALAQQIQSMGGVSTAATALAQLKTDAQAAKTAADAAAALIGTALTTANTNVTSVNSNAIVAQYNNPAIATTAGFQHALASSSTLSAGMNKKVDGDGGLKANINYVLDGAKNLVEIRNTSFKSGDFGVTASPDYASADVKFSGGTAADTFKLADNTLYLGRWSGGTVSVDDASNGTGVDATVDLGSGLTARSVHWLIAQQAPANYAQNKLTGTTSYTLLANTAPTDTAGNVGTVGSATLTANFTARTVDAGVNLTVATKTMGLSIAGMSITGNDFGGTSSSVSCSGAGCSGTYAGDLQGGFVRLDASGAGFKYGIWPTVASTGPYSDLIRGLVAFSGTPTIAPQPTLNVATAYRFDGASNAATFFRSPGTSYTRDGNEDLTAVARGPAADEAVSETVSGGTAQTAGRVTTAGGTVVDFGRWQGPSVSVARVDSSGSSTRAVDGSYNWIAGTATTPVYLPQALAVTATYTTTATSGMVTDHNNTVGTIDAASTLTVNFTKQQVDADIRASVGGNTWQALGTGIRLSNNGFFARKGATTLHQNLDVFMNTSNTGTAGSISGTLMGNGVDAAGVGFSFAQGGGANTATGTVAFTGTAQSQATSYVSGIVAAGMLGTTLSPSGTVNSGTATLASLDVNLVNSVDTVIDSSLTSRVGRDAANQVVKFDASLPVLQPAACTSGSCTGVAYTPGTFQARDADILVAPPGIGQPVPATTLTNTGSDSATGITWGRYVGFLAYSDRIGAAAGNPAVTSGTLDARTSNWHGIWSGAQTSLPVLPTSGTFTYTALGGTLPTDSTGAIGAATSTATLTANFTAMTVNTSVNATVGTNTWAASANNIPILQASTFAAEKINGAGNLTVTVNGSGTNTAGKLNGIFTGNAVTGTTGGAMMGYSLNVGGATGTTMQGVTAFKK